MPRTAYNQYDPLQNAFLSALAKGESPGGEKGLYIGVGGADLRQAPVDEYGFPQWSGFGNSHAAGWFQFQPGTWEEYASKYQLNFRSPDDQKAGAWLLAQDRYKANTGRDLTEALKAGDYLSVENALSKTWTSTPGRLANTLAQGDGVDIGTETPISADTSPLARLAGSLPLPGIGLGGADMFVRIGLLVIGAVVILIALWHLLSQTGVVPSPADTAKLAGGVAGAAAKFI
jgi:muramidase (phage lysozyme)